MSAYQWRRRWRAAGKGCAGFGGRGRGGMPAGPGAAGLAAGRAGPGPGWGWGEDQRWTLERTATLTGRLSHVRYTLRGTSHLLHRLGYTPQVPVHHAAERGEKAIAAGRDVTRVKLRGGGDRGRTCASRTRPGSPCGPRRPGPGPAVAVRRWPW